MNKSKLSTLIQYIYLLHGGWFWQEQDLQGYIRDSSAIKSSRSSGIYDGGGQHGQHGKYGSISGGYNGGFQFPAWAICE